MSSIPEECERFEIILNSDVIECPIDGYNSPKTHYVTGCIHIDFKRCLFDVDQLKLRFLGGIVSKRNDPEVILTFLS